MAPKYVRIQSLGVSSEDSDELKKNPSETEGNKAKAAMVLPTYMGEDDS